MLNKELFENGVKNLKKIGFSVKLGSLTKKMSSEGYRSGSPMDRAEEFMEMIENDNIRAILTTIGGMNSSSLIPYLDFKKTANARKTICGYSDITSLHLSILKFSGLSTFYGPGLMTWLDEYPDGNPYLVESFLSATSHTSKYPKSVTPPSQWSNHFRDWNTNDWKEQPRKYHENKGWRVLSPGVAESQLIACNLSTLLTAAGTDYFPNLTGKILLIESMSAAFSEEERALRQLQLMGVFEKISGLIIGKPEFPDPQGAPFSHNALLKEVIGKKSFPIVSEFDCSHTLPMIALAQGVRVKIEACENYDVKFEILESMVEKD